MRLLSERVCLCKILLLSFALNEPKWNSICNNLSVCKCYVWKTYCSQAVFKFVPNQSNCSFLLIDSWFRFFCMQIKVGEKKKLKQYIFEWKWSGILWHTKLCLKSLQLEKVVFDQLLSQWSACLICFTFL